MGTNFYFIVEEEKETKASKESANRTDATTKKECKGADEKKDKETKAQKESAKETIAATMKECKCAEEKTCSIIPTLRRFSDDIHVHIGKRSPCSHFCLTCQVAFDQFLCPACHTYVRTSISIRPVCTFIWSNLKHKWLLQQLAATDDICVEDDEGCLYTASQFLAEIATTCLLEKEQRIEFC